ncbi:hypothetical protein DMC47_34745 [Nostoc sp. 3335mG]|nr:hypothetical protein DMC47_34745 [Nostoc sp. 3335mG]
MGKAWANGDWVNARRVRLVCTLLLLATILSYAFLLLTAHGTLDTQGRPIGTDFSDVYAAGWMADHGRATAAWVWPEHYKIQQALHHSTVVPFYGWHYPPPFLLLASLLATMPYLAALALWIGTTLAGAVMVARKIVSGPGTALAVPAAPASFVCIGHGQNAFLTATLLAGGLVLLDRRPWMAGLLLGCLVYKPQFAVLLPVVLIAAGNKRAFAGAAISSLSLVVITLAIWGWPVWQAFHDSLILTRTRVIETGETGWEKIVTSFATARMLGAPIPLAYGFQAISTALAIAGAAIAARWASPALRGVAVCCAALLSTPYAMDYDLVVLGGALCFLVSDARERGWLDHEKSILALAYLTPLFGRQIAALTLVPVNWIAIVAVFVVTLRRTWVLDLAQTPFGLILSKPCPSSSG